MKKMNRVLSLLLSAAMLMGTLTPAAFAEETIAETSVEATATAETAAEESPVETPAPSAEPQRTEAPAETTAEIDETVVNEDEAPDTDYATGLIYDESLDTRYHPIEAETLDAAARAAIPAKYDLRELNRSTGVKNQNYWGTCWAFAAVASMESYLMTHYPELGEVDLSELYIAWEAGQLLNDEGSYQATEKEYFNSNILQQGGDYMQVAAIASRLDGLLTEVQLPYFSEEAGRNVERVEGIDYTLDADRNEVMTESFKNAWTVSEEEENQKKQFRWLNSVAMNSTVGFDDRASAVVYRDEAADIVKQYIMENGAVEVSLYFGGDDKYYNKDTAARYCYNIGAPSNHGLTIVGWDDDYAATNFKKAPPRDGAWIVKNSWGTDWGDNGYFYLSYYDQSVTGITGDQVVPVDDETAEISTLYQYDEIGSPLACGGWLADRYKVANVFRTDDDEQLTELKVVLLPSSTEAIFSVYDLGNTTMSPVKIRQTLEQKVLETPLTEQSVEYLNGMATITLDDPVILEKGHYFAVVMEEKGIISGQPHWATPVSAGFKVHYGLCKDGKFSDNAGPMVDQIVIDEGESFRIRIMDDCAEAVDVATLTDSSQYIDNVNIKAVTVKVDLPAPTAVPATPAPTAVPATPKPTAAPAPTATPKPNYGSGQDGFVNRLYGVCLDRKADATGKAYWLNELKTKSGSEVAGGFVFSNEFKAKNYCNTDYIKQLYRAFMGREAEPGGLKYWQDQFAKGAKREEVFNGFAASNEFKGICASYGIAVGNGIDVPAVGTTADGRCAICGAEDGVTAFVTRLYKTCLNRTPDATGIKYWCDQLHAQTTSGKAVAHGFVFSDEFTKRGFNNDEYLNHLYEAFMDRKADAGGKKYWLDKMAAGATREDVFNGFVVSNEFTGICASYGITRG